MSSDTRFVEKKVEGGKLVQLELEKKNEQIYNVSLTGDFFVYPEEEKKSIEKALKGMSVKSSLSELERAINESLSSESELLGFDISTVAKLTKEAIEDEE